MSDLVLDAILAAAESLSVSESSPPSSPGGAVPRRLPASLRGGGGVSEAHFALEGNAPSRLMQVSR